MKYTVWVTFEFSKECGMDEVNKFMHSCGFNEKAMVISKVPLYTVEVNRELTPEEKEIYRQTFEEELSKKLSLKILRVELY